MIWEAVKDRDEQRAAVQGGGTATNFSRTAAEQQRTADIEP